MKKALIVLLSMFMIYSVHAQTNKTVSKFSDFYKANQPDSIYTLFSSEIKTALKLEGTRQLVAQIKGQLGEIVGVRKEDASANGLTDFRLSFEKPLFEISLVISNDLIAGLTQKAVKSKGVDSTEVNSPDNFYVENKIGRLNGTMTLPKTKGKVPVVLMIGGSGPTDRNMNQGEALKTNSFYLIANALAEKGIASVRYDKRGVGKSMSAVNTANVTLDDFIDDAKLFINKLASDDRFSNVIVLGHSEGALIGLIASLQTKPAAYISVCGTKKDMVTLIGEQLKPMLTPEDFSVYTQISDSLKARKIFSKPMPAALTPIFNPRSQGFLISTLKYDSGRELAKLKIPVLLIGGTTDLQVPAEAATQLSKINNKASLMVIPEMNHVLKKAPLDRASNLATYNNGTLPLHSDIMPILVDFITKNPRLK